MSDTELLDEARELYAFCKQKNEKARSKYVPIRARTTSKYDPDPEDMTDHQLIVFLKMEKRKEMLRLEKNLESIRAKRLKLKELMDETEICLDRIDKYMEDIDSKKKDKKKKRSKK